MYIGIVSPTMLLEKYSSPHFLQYCYGEIARKSPEYLSFYKRMVQQNKIVILDYSPRLPRTTRGFGIHDMVRLAKEIKPKYVVLPCVEYSVSLTQNQSENAAAFFALALPALYNSGLRFIGLPQGNTKTEIERSAKNLLRISGVELLGLSATLELVVPRETLKIDSSKTCLLDIYNLIEDEITSMDCWGLITSLPIRLGAVGKKILDKCSKVELDFSLDQDSKNIEENMEMFMGYIG